MIPRTKRGFLYPFLFVCVLVGVGCSSGDQGEHLSFGAGRYLRDIKSSNVLVRKNAIYYLGEKRVKEAVPLLIDLLDADQPKSVKLNAVSALGKIQESSSVDVLIQLLDEKDDELREEAIWALGQIKDPKAIMPLSRLATDNGDRLAVIWAMGNIGDKTAVPLLTELLNKENKFVRYNAAQSLKKIGQID